MVETLRNPFTGRPAMTIDMTLHVAHHCEGERANQSPMPNLPTRVFRIGQTVQYLGHVPGGSVLVQAADGTRWYCNPFAFQELS